MNVLQGINLPFIDMPTADGGLNISLSVQGQALPPQTGFADIFRLQPRSLPELPLPGELSLPGGTDLPRPGNDLPMPDVAVAEQVRDTLDIPDAPIETDDWTTEVQMTWSPMLPATVPTIVPTTAPAMTLVAEPTMTPGLALVTATPAVQSLESGIANGSLPIEGAESRLARAALPPVALAQNSQSASALAPTTGPAVAATTEVLSPAIQSLQTPRADASPALPEIAAKLLQPVISNREQHSVARDPELPAERRLVESVAPLKATVGNETTVPIVADASNRQSAAAEFLQNGAIQGSTIQPNLVTGRAVPDAITTPASISQAIDVPVNADAWGDRIGERLLMMSGSKLQSAEIRLTPAELGPLRVQIAIDDGVASVTFHAQHALTREALEQAMPRLRELFAENGLTLEQGHIADADGKDVRHGKQDGGGAAASASTDNAAVEDEQHVAMAHGGLSRPGSDKLVDTFA
jgi:flagellar hook-length control protein FliK